ncbi:MAG TPA: hypothetical protein GX503_06290, partial [Clostridiales bacterium]|nr:hypothetical protein [Clostridiales bacterium]
SDYSGYYIIPPMNFKGMQELLIGLQKEDVYEYMLESHRHHCLNLRNDPNPSPFETNKILGGNLAIKLEALENIPPFFSSAYTVGGETVLTRGEDTLWGLAFQNAPVKCIDIDAPIFHDTYNSYPDVPDILRDKSVQDRFYHACLGWIGRNPFLNWKSGKNLEECKAVQLKNIEIGAKALAKYTDNERFLMLPQALQISYDRIHHVIQQYNELQNAWDELIQKLKEKGRRIHEDIDRQSFSV